MIQKLKLKYEFTRNVLTLMTGTTIAQVILIAISPILTRMFSPEEFGLLALYLSILGPLSIIATGRYEIAIVLPKDDSEAMNILALSVFITIFLTSLISIVLVIYYEELLLFLNAGELDNLIFLLPLSFFLSGINQAFSFWANRKKHFSTMAKARVSQSFGVATGQLGLGFGKLDGALLIGNVCGRVISTSVLVKKFITHDFHLISAISCKSILRQMRKYKEFPLVNSFHAFSDTAKVSLSFMLIAIFFGQSILGFYSLAIRILQTPLMIIGSSFGQVLYQELNSLKATGKRLEQVVKQVLLKLILFSLPIFILLYFFAPDLFSFVFGAKWEIVGEYIKLMIPYLFLTFLISPISQIPIIMEKQQKFFQISLIGNIGMPLMIYLGFEFGASFEKILLIISLVFSVYYSLVLYWVLSLVRNKK